MKRVLLLCSVLLSVSVIIISEESADSITAAELSDLYSVAKRLFAEANELRDSDPSTAADSYRRSALYFERIAEEGGIRNGKLFYNIGNVYFRLGDLGRAILNYRRALALTPNDPNLNRNIEYARSKRIDAIESEERTAIARILFFWHFDLSSRGRVIAFALCFVLVWVFAGLKAVLNRSGFVWAAVVFAALSVLLIGSLSWESIDAARNMPGTILADEVVGRKGDSETYQPSFQEPLHAGTEFTLRESRESWLLVELTDGRQTWLPREAVGLLTYD